ncbi:hypothetical protein HU200_016868 [Digitaria exilis]|uniref:Uncharacterized protein n=1 Tax=Digitaria exilis TaxID=1010633 RepID=A0A835KI82_9POAL|nr:hypothetical protein HU200_016868 [Digitaria exilis]
MGGGLGRQRQRGRRVPSSGQYVPPGRRGFWVSLHGQNQEVVEEVVDFAQDSEVGGGDDFLFVSEPDEEISEEISDDFVDVSFVPETGPSASNARASPPRSTVPPHSIGSFDNNMEIVHGLEAGAWQDIAGHSQPQEEEADVKTPEPKELEIGSSDEFREVRDSMLKILVPLYFENARD